MTRSALLVLSKENITGSISWNYLHHAAVRIHWRLSMISETSNKMYEVNVFWYVKLCIFNTYCIQYTILSDKTQPFRKFPSGKTNDIKNAFLFPSGVPTQLSFTFNLWFLYELKRKVHLSETACGIIHFWFPFVFIKVYIFVQQNVWTLWLQNVITPFNIEIIEKTHTDLL